MRRYPQRWFCRASCATSARTSSGTGGLPARSDRSISSAPGAGARPARAPSVKQAGQTLRRVSSQPIPLSENSHVCPARHRAFKISSTSIQTRWHSVSPAPERHGRHRESDGEVGTCTGARRREHGVARSAVRAQSREARVASGGLEWSSGCLARWRLYTRDGRYH
jgi:hypothetical protein